MRCLSQTLVCFSLVLLACGEPSEHTAPTEATPPAAAPGTSEPPIDASPALVAGEVKFVCAEDASAQPDSLKRLTMTQYRNTVRDLARWALGDAREADALLTYV